MAEKKLRCVHGGLDDLGIIVDVAPGVRGLGASNVQPCVFQVGRMLRPLHDYEQAVAVPVVHRVVHYDAAARLDGEQVGVSRMRGGARQD